MNKNKKQKTIKDAVKLLKSCLKRNSNNLIMDQIEDLNHAIFLLETNIDIFREDNI